MSVVELSPGKHVLHSVNTVQGSYDSRGREGVTGKEEGAFQINTTESMLVERVTGRKK